MLNEWSDREPDPKRPYFASWEFAAGAALVFVVLAGFVFLGALLS